MNYFILKLLILVYVVNSTPLINNNKSCVKRLLPSSLIIGVKKSGNYYLHLKTH